jgi:hypothetical protein
MCAQSAHPPLALQVIEFDMKAQMNPFISGSTVLFARFYPPDAMKRIAKSSHFASLLSQRWTACNTIIIPVEHRQFETQCIG